MLLYEKLILQEIAIFTLYELSQHNRKNNFAKYPIYIKFCVHWKINEMGILYGSTSTLYLNTAKLLCNYIYYNYKILILFPIIDSIDIVRTKLWKDSSGFT